MIKIIIVEDDIKLNSLIKTILERSNFIVDSAYDPYEALEKMSKNVYHLIISDIMMPEMDGYELVRTIRESGSTIPIMLITAKSTFDDMRLGFLSGSDDYMVKPVNVNEMVLRVAALLRRAQMTNERRLTIGNTILEYDTFTVYSLEETIVLPLKEFLLLYKMCAYPSKIFTRQQLMDDIWGYDSESDTHTVDVHIERLRKKFKENSDFEIVTMRGIGYKVIKK